VGTDDSHGDELVFLPSRTIRSWTQNRRNGDDGCCTEDNDVPVEVDEHATDKRMLPPLFEVKSSSAADDDDDDPETDTSFQNGGGILLCHRRFPSSWDSLKCSCNDRTRRNDTMHTTRSQNCYKYKIPVLRFSHEQIAQKVC
jgi:hypothetical protein